MHEPTSIADITFERIAYGEDFFYVCRLEDGWYHVPANCEPDEVEGEMWDGPYADKTDAISDAAERIDLANS